MPSPPFTLGAEPPSLAMVAAFAHSLNYVRPLEDWLTPKGTFIFTRDGAQFMREMVEHAYWSTDRSALPPPDPTLPRWDYENRQLWIGNRLIKTYRKGSGRLQIAILAAFEDAGWLARRIDCPRPFLTAGSRQAVRKRLYKVVRRLNESLPDDSLRFYDDGTALAVWWEPAPSKVVEVPPQSDPGATAERPDECHSPPHDSAGRPEDGLAIRPT